MSDKRYLLVRRRDLFVAFSSEGLHRKIVSLRKFLFSFDVHRSDFSSPWLMEGSMDAICIFINTTVVCAAIDLRLASKKLYNMIRKLVGIDTLKSIIKSVTEESCLLHVPFTCTQLTCRLNQVLHKDCDEVNEYDIVHHTNWSTCIMVRNYSIDNVVSAYNVIHSSNQCISRYDNTDIMLQIYDKDGIVNFEKLYQPGYDCRLEEGFTKSTIRSLKYVLGSLLLKISRLVVVYKVDMCKSNHDFYHTCIQSAILV